MQEKLSITRIKAPKFKVGKFVLNEYEVRNLQVEVYTGVKKPGIVVIGEDKLRSTIQVDGKFDIVPTAYRITFDLVIKLLK